MGNLVPCCGVAHIISEISIFNFAGDDMSMEKVFQDVLRLELYQYFSQQASTTETLLGLVTVLDCCNTIVCLLQKATFRNYCVDVTSLLGDA